MPVVSGSRFILPGIQAGHAGRGAQEQAGRRPGGDVASLGARDLRDDPARRGLKLGDVHAVPGGLDHRPGDLVVEKPARQPGGRPLRVDDRADAELLIDTHVVLRRPRMRPDPRIRVAAVTGSEDGQDRGQRSARRAGVEPHLDVLDHAPAARVGWPARDDPLSQPSSRECTAPESRVTGGRRESSGRGAWPPARRPAPPNRSAAGGCPAGR